MRWVVHYAAAMVAWGTLFVVVVACVTGTMPRRWLASMNVSHLIVHRQLREASAANLKFIGQGLTRYRAKFGRWPTSLADLERARVSKGILESPLGGHYVLTGPSTGDGRGVICRELDVPGGGGGGDVLYADGRVEWVANP